MARLSGTDLYSIGGMQASNFEFRNRWWMFGAIFGVAFFTFAFDHRPLGVRLGDRLAVDLGWSADAAYRLVFGAAALIMVLAALVRTWGSAYLGRQVVHDAKLHSETLKADGPYRRVRNPLYLGNLLMGAAMILIAPIPGAVIIAIALPLFLYRLIGREEAGLEAEQGEEFRAFKRAVPRLLPAASPRIPAGGLRPDWKNGLSSEAFFWSFALGTVLFAVTLKVLFFYAGLLASPLLSWLAGLALGTESKARKAGAE